MTLHSAGKNILQESVTQVGILCSSNSWAALFVFLIVQAVQQHRDLVVDLLSVNGLEVRKALAAQQFWGAHGWSAGGEKGTGSNKGVTC